MLRNPSAAAALLLLVACTEARSPSAPEDRPPPDFAAAAFRLTIDVASGQVTVRSPAGPRAQATGPSFSLLGGDAVALHATNCTWSNGSSSKQRRCTFDLAVENLLGGTDLVRPTTFPVLPQGMNGIVVFPFAAAALGVKGGAAVPTADWDNAPANFFNDFGGCSGNQSDCYRSETYPAPLYGGETSGMRTVGFDVDKNAQSVSLYVVVAADLRDNIPQTVTATPFTCGHADAGGSGSSGPSVEIEVGVLGPVATRGFCSFALPNVLAGKDIARATLRMFQKEVDPSAYLTTGVVLVDHIDIDANLLAMFDAVPLQANIGTLSTNAILEYKTLDVAGAVEADVLAGRGLSEYRLRVSNESVDELSPTGIATFDAAQGDNPPELVILYRNR